MVYYRRAPRARAASRGARLLIRGQFLTAVQWRSCVRRLESLEKLPLVEDRGQADLVTTPTRAGLRRCCWPRPPHASRHTALVRS